MNRNEIEEKDQHLLKKIRTIVAQKEKQTTSKRVLWKAPGIWLASFCIGLVVFGLTAFKQSSTTLVTGDASQPAQIETEKTDALAEKEADGTVAPAVPSKTQDTPIAAEKTVFADTSSAGQMAESDRSVPPLPAESETTGTDIAERHPPTTAPAVKPVETEMRSRSAAVQISHLVTCGGVRDKQYINQKSVFSLAVDPIAMVWMRVLSEAPPYTLTHVYSLNGRHYCDVPLKIPYPHMRTWSKITLNRKTHIGKWHVDVVTENGEIVDTIDFTVVP